MGFTQMNRSHARRASAWIASLVAVMVISAVSTACGGTDPRDPLELVPARANMIGSVDLALVLADVDVTEAYDLIAASDDTMPATLSELLAMSEEELGLDLSGFGTLLLFADVDSLTDGSGEGTDLAEFAGVLAATDLKQSDLFDAIRVGASVAATAGEYEGVDLLDLDGGDTSVALVDGVLAFGSIDAVHAVIDVARADAPVVSGTVLDFYNELGDVWFKLALTVPDDLTDSVGDVGEFGLPVDVSALLEIEGLGVVATKDRTNAIIRVVLRYSTPELAIETQEALTGLLALVVGLLGDDQLSEVADVLEIAAVGNDVTIELRQDVQESLDDLRQTLEEIEDTNPFGIGL
jgi:hypothetical protein